MGEIGRKLLICVAGFLFGCMLIIAPFVVISGFLAPKKPPVIEQIIEHYGSYDNIVDDYIPETNSIVKVVEEYPSCKEIALEMDINNVRGLDEIYFVKKDLSYTRK